MFRKVRDFNELMYDKHFAYQVGRLIGASEMASHHMLIHGDDETKSVGQALRQVTDWFFIADRSGEDTAITQQLRAIPEKNPTETEKPTEYTKHR